jgi:uncharacterized membrane protein/mono/diheme cytochrome c family protein
MQFLAVVGRTHLLLLHFPIAVMFAVLILEVALRKREERRVVIGPLLVVGAVGSLVAMATGLMYAPTEEFHGHTLTLLAQHRIGGIVAAVLSCVAFVAHQRAELKVAYLPALVCACVAVTFTGHRGGQMVHGDNYITEPLHQKDSDDLDKGPVVASDGAEPGEKKSADERGRWPEGAVPDKPDYAKDIKPIIERSCLKCHGPEKRKNGLRLDKKRFAMKGGETGPAIIAGDVEKSLLTKYISLPVDDDDIMPSKGKLLANSEIETLKKWVAQGAEWPDDP